MVERQAISRLNREFVILKQANTPQFTASPSESDMLTWHYVIHDLPKDSPYYGGQYHGKLVFPREYPLKPPSISMCTPSGRFEINKRLCLSMSDYHPESWNPSWRVETILIGLVSFMLDESDPATAGGMRASKGHRQQEALLSFFRNRKNKEFCSLFPTMVDPSKYHLGLGFLTTPPAGPTTTLAQCRLSDAELASVQSLDDLSSILRVKGVQVTAAHEANSDKVLMNSILPWGAVAVVVVAWVYSQLKSIPS